jgi:hypothetical protein
VTTGTVSTIDYSTNLHGMIPRVGAIAKFHGVIIPSERRASRIHCWRALRTLNAGPEIRLIPFHIFVVGGWMCGLVAHLFPDVLQ